MDTDRSDSWWVVGLRGGLRDRVAFSLRTLANLLEAMREERLFDSREAGVGEEALGDVMQQVNAMATTLRAAAPRRAGGDDAAAQGDGGDRRRDFRVR